MERNGWYTFLRGLVYWPVKLLLPTKIVGKERIPLPERVITVSNHHSVLDIVVISIGVKGYRRLIGKKELEKSWFLRTLMRLIDAIAIDRGKADLSAMRKVLGALKNGGSVTMFPEGTRNKTGSDSMQEVKAGAALFAIKGNAQIVPIMLYKKPRFFRKNYIFVGEPFSVAEEGTRADANAVNAGAVEIERRMHEAADYLTDYVVNKRWKEIRRAKREEKKRLKAERRAAKKAARG